MKILRVQPVPDGRSYKIGEVLQNEFGVEVIRAVYSHDSPMKYGESITLARSKREATGFMRYANFMVWPFYRGLARRILDIAVKESVDIFHSNNSPDIFGVLCKKYGDRPIIHEINDLYSLYDEKKGREITPSLSSNPMKIAFWKYYRKKELAWEAYVHRESDAMVFSSEGQKRAAEKKYGKLNAIAIPNGVLRRYLPKRRKAKLSEADGRIHCVFLGIFEANPRSHRMIVDQLKEIAENKGLVLHLYCVPRTRADAEILSDSLEHVENVIIHKPLPYEFLYEELTQYDLGLIILNPKNERLLEASLPNKIFEYVAAGLPVAVSPYTPLVEFVSEYDCGFPVENWRTDISDNIERIREVPFREEFTIDYYVPKLVKIYENLC